MVVEVNLSKFIIILNRIRVHIAISYHACICYLVVIP